MPLSQAALRRALVRTMALPIIKRKKRPHRDIKRDWRKAGPNRANQNEGTAVAESENIVAETAEKIFADLADAQTINRDKQDAWKAPLWKALTESGLPLAWVPEDCGGSGASLAEGFGRLERRRTFSRSRCRWPKPCWPAGCSRRPKSPRPTAK